MADTSPSSAPKRTPDTVTPAAPGAPTISVPGNAKIAPLLRDAIAGLHLAKGAENYKATLIELRQTEGAPAYLAQTYQAAATHEYMERWSITTVLADLHHPDALDPLHTIAAAPLPAVSGEEAPHILAEETIIRTAAVEGIARQAAQNPTARALLLQSVQSSCLFRQTCRRAGVPRTWWRARRSGKGPARPRALPVGHPLCVRCPTAHRCTAWRGPTRSGA